MHLKPADRGHGRRQTWHVPMTMQNDLLRLLLVSLILLTSTSCAMLKGREPEVEPAPAIPLPEVRQITFTGNTQFSSRTLLGEMTTQPRPFLRFWRKGEPYNPPTLQEDLLRIRKYYFDRGFLETTARVEQVHGLIGPPPLGGMLSSRLSGRSTCPGIRRPEVRRRHPDV